MSLPRDFERALVAATPSTIEYRGRFLGVIDAPSAALDVEIDGSAPPLLVGAGGSIVSPAPFSRVRLTSSVNQTVRVRIADEVQDISNIVGGGGGGVSLVEEEPAAAVTDQAPVVVATATEAALFAANLARRRIAVHVDSANPGSCFARQAGASVNNIAELQPGVVYRFDGTYGLDVRNDTGGNATFYLFEES